MQKILQTEVLPKSSFYTDKLLHGVSFQTAILYREAFTPRICYTEKFLHREVFTQRNVCTEQVFTQRT